MPVNLRGKNFLTLLDFTPDQIRYLLDLSRDFKNAKRAGIPHAHLAGKNSVLLFEKSSTRTRVSFETGLFQLDGHALFLSSRDIQLERGESIKATAGRSAAMWTAS